MQEYYCVIHGGLYKHNIRRHIHFDVDDTEVSEILFEGHIKYKKLLMRHFNYLP